MKNEAKNFPKIECPFVRKNVIIEKESYEEEKALWRLRNRKLYLVTDQINPGYEWVFNDPDTIAVEKLNGTNFLVETEKGKIINCQNRANVINLLELQKNNFQVLRGIGTAIKKGVIENNGTHYGELLGPGIQGNCYDLNEIEWYPFSKALHRLDFKSFSQYEKNYKDIRVWFKENLFSRFYLQRHAGECTHFAEGLVFYNLKRKEEGLTWRAKLRRDMFDFYYTGLIFNPEDK